MRALGRVQIWPLSVVVLMMWSRKCEIPTDVHDSHSTVAMAQLFPGKISVDFSLSAFLTLLISEVLLTTITRFFSDLNSVPQPSYIPDYLKQHLDAGESSSNTHILLLFTFPEKLIPRARAKQAKCTYNKSPAQKLKHRIIVPDERSNKDLRRCQNFLS